MRKRVWLVIGVLAFAMSVFGEGIKIYAPVAQRMLIDSKNYVRYSPLNMFDGNAETVFAVTYGEINPKEPLVTIYFAEPAAFDTLSVLAGYFDERYYRKNNRIKRMTVQIWNSRYKDYEATLSLNDVQQAQTLYSGKKIIATKIVLYADSVYPGTAWDDVVISDLLFARDGTVLPVSVGTGSCVYGEFFHSYDYDDNGRVVKEHLQYGHAGSKTRYYKYEGGKIFRATIDMDDDPNNPRYVPIDHIDTTDSGKQLHTVASRVVAESVAQGAQFSVAQYLYDEAGRVQYIVRISESAPDAYKIIAYTYNKDGLLAQEVGYTDATIYTKRYE